MDIAFIEDFKLYLLDAPCGGTKKGTISQNTASTYFSIFKAGLKQAFVEGYLMVDISAKVKGIPDKQVRREYLTLDELDKLAETPCDDVLKRAALFSTLTSLRHCDIQELRWGDIVKENGRYRINFTQEKTDGVEYQPISEDTYKLCGTTGEPDRLVFEDLQGPLWINAPLKRWVELAKQFSEAKITLHELVNEVFEPWEQVNEAQANLLGQAFILACGGEGQVSVGTGSAGSQSELPWRDKDKNRGMKR